MTAKDEKKKIMITDALSLANDINYQKGSIVSKNLFENENGSITLFAFDQNQNLSEHTSQFDAVVHVIEGEAEFIINKAPHTLAEGQMILMPANIPHAVNALKCFKMLLILMNP